MVDWDAILIDALGMVVTIGLTCYVLWVWGFLHKHDGKSKD